MFIHKIFVIAFFVMLCAWGDAITNPSHAAICFLPSGNCNGGSGFGSADDNMDLDTNKQCENEGYKLEQCNEAQVPIAVCPYNSSYISGCKCRSDLQTCTDVQDGVGTSCDGKFISCVCKAGMKTCNNAETGVGNACNNTYASCKCKNNLKTCDGLYTGVGDSCGKQYNSCQCRADLKQCNAAQDGVGNACDGKYDSCTCKPNLVECTDVQDGVGDSCDKKYATCVCKPNLVECEKGKRGIGNACGGKYASCECSDNLNKCGELEVGSGAECGGNFETCTCKDTLIACTNNLIGVGKDCGGKFESCKCPDNWTECQYGAPSNAQSCTAPGKSTVYSACSEKCTAEFQKIECKKYEDVRTCANDESMKVCTPTCESKLAEAGYKVNENVDGAVITKDTTFTSTTGKNFKSVEDFRTKFPVECSVTNRPKPTLSYVIFSGNPDLSHRTFNNLNLSVIGGEINLSNSTIQNGNFSTSSKIFVGESHYTFNFTSEGSRKTFKSGKIQVVHGANFKINNALMTISGLFVWNTSNVIINNTQFNADYLETITSDSRVEFSGSLTSVRVKNTFIGGVENLGGQNVYRRGAVIRVKDGANWYVSEGNVRIRDGALFCAGYGGRIWFSGGNFGGKYNDQYQGCRIYHDKDRTLSYGDWDPSSYTSWSGRGGC